MPHKKPEVRAKYLKENYRANRATRLAKVRAYRRENAKKISLQRKVYRENNKEKVAAQKKRYRDANREAVIARIRDWRAANKESCASKCKAYYEANRSACLALRRLRYEQNRESELALNKKYRRKNQEALAGKRKEYAATHRELIAALKRNRKARMKGAEGKHTGNDIKEIWARQKHKCAVRGCTHPISDKKGGPDKYHVDHIKAVINGGSNWPDNLQILCGKHNLEKAARDEYEWAQEHGLLFPK